MKCRHEKALGILSEGQQTLPFVEVCYRSPPLAIRCSPVSHLESSDARNTAVGAISSTWPVRPNGVWPTTAFSKSEPINPAARDPSVSTIPGLIEFTLILRGPSSLAKTLVIA